MLNLFIYASSDEGAELLWNGSREADEGGFVLVGYDDRGQDLPPGNYLVVSDDQTEKALLLETITMLVSNPDLDLTAGTAPPGRFVWASAGSEFDQQGVGTTADETTGEWTAHFVAIGFDITEEMRPWSNAQIYEGDGDANEASPPPRP
jgi:hypothetical protein